MPIKEFVCTRTNYEHMDEKPVRFEKRFSSHEHYLQCRDHQAIYCPQCGDGQCVELVVSKPAPAQFKGTGFYSTDYK